MRDLTVSEIEMVSGGDFWDDMGEAMSEVASWWQGVGAAIQNALNNWIKPTTIDTNQQTAIAQCIQAGGTTGLTQSGPSYSVSISAPTRTITFTSTGGTSTYTCTQH